MMRGTCYYNKKIKVENVAESAKIVTKVQTFRDCALRQWNVRLALCTFCKTRFTSHIHFRGRCIYAAK